MGRILLLLLCMLSLSAGSYLSKDFHSLPSILSARDLNILSDLTTAKFYKAADELPASGCPAEEIDHTRILAHPTVNDTYAVPHNGIYMNGFPCGNPNVSSTSELEAGHFMWVIPGKFLEDATKAAAAEVVGAYAALKTNQRALAAYRQLQSISEVYIGVEEGSDRVCGVQPGLEYPRHSIFILIRPEEDALDFGPTVGYFYNQEVGIISLKPDSSACIMKNTRREGPDQEPFATREPFPTQEFIARPSPSQSPKEPATPSVPITSSASPSASPIPSKTHSAVLSSTPNGSASSEPSSIFTVDDLAPSPDSEKACFPESAMVQLKRGGSKTMSELNVGDEVKVGPNNYSPVFMFTHRQPDLTFKYIRLETASGRALLLSSGHYLYSNGQLQTAGSTKIGQFLTNENGGRDQIISKKVKVEKGLYHPQTLSGDIVVNEIKVSTFTTAVHPKMAQLLLAPIHFLYRHNLLPTQLCRFLETTSYGLERFMPKGPQVINIR